MSFVAAVQSGFRNYARFGGRASRSEYWWFVLFGTVAQSLASIINETLGLVATLALAIPSLAVGARRMHDVNKSGWWILVPVVNLVLACRKTIEVNSRPAPSVDRLTHVDSPVRDTYVAKVSDLTRSQLTSSYREMPRPQPRAHSGYRYRNAPQSAVDACVEALKLAGVECKIATFEADIDRIIVASDMNTALTKQMKGLPPDAVELILGTEKNEAAITVSELLAPIIRQHLGPWLEK